MKHEIFTLEMRHWSLITQIITLDVRSLKNWWYKYLKHEALDTLAIHAFNSVNYMSMVNYITPLKKNLLNSPVAALGICFGRGLRYHCTLYFVILPLSLLASRLCVHSLEKGH